MKKYMAFAFALLMAATIFGGCARGTVSDDPTGRITDPTGNVEPTSPIPTMTIPMTESMTKPTDETTRPEATVETVRPEATDRVPDESTTVRPDSPSTDFPDASHSARSRY